MSTMFRVYGVMSVVGLVLWIFCIIDSISARQDEVRNLPKVAWVIIVFLFPFVGSIAWLVAGRPRSSERPLQPWERSQPEFPEYNRPGRAAASDPEKDAEFLRQVRARAEEQRRAYRERQAREQEQSNDDDATDASAG
jgi:hypothetical protein